MSHIDVPRPKDGRNELTSPEFPPDIGYETITPDSQKDAKDDQGKLLSVEEKNMDARQAKATALLKAFMFVFSGELILCYIADAVL